MDDEIKKLQSKIIDLEDMISQQGTRANYVKTLIEQILNDYFMNPNPEMEDIRKIMCEYSIIYNFLEIAHDYIYQIRKGVEDCGLL